ncbi:MAG: ribosome-associated translation inhibitor RaiA [Bacteroidaceae bacterium]|nr:ribosome-associated translation inhibitor RaiA [Bacteroidaceae bacterium]MBR0433510.1 ribosome-associated translation inhibitor RaiA [Bacteroidaceae bacterium]
MEINIQAIRFEPTEKLQDFVHKKVGKLEKFSDEIRKVEVSLKLVKPETAMNKEAAIRVFAGSELFASKVCDTFEEAIDNCMDALLRQLQKNKEKSQNR